jgi:hypothetical protein
MGAKSFENVEMSLDDVVDTLDGLPERIAVLEKRFLHLQAEMRREFSAVRHEIQCLAETLRIELRAGDAETRSYMRVLHEEVLSRLAAVRRR